MGSNKEKQAARHEALNEVANAHPDEFAEAMAKAYAKRDLGTYTPRATQEQRAAAKAEAKKQAAAARIKAEAKKAGISVLIVDAPDVEEKIKAAQDGTLKGVSYDWHADENGFTDESTADVVSRVAREAEEFEALTEEEQDTRLAVARDQAAAPVTD